MAFAATMGKANPEPVSESASVPDNPLNVSRPATGRQTNNAAESEAAVEAARRAQDAGIKKFRINTDSKYLVSSAAEWIPTWEKNDWKTAENKPVKNRTEFEKIKTALEPIEVIWNHGSTKEMKQLLL